MAGMIKMPTASDALVGRDGRMAVAADHVVLKKPLQPPYPEGLVEVLFAMGCFWGAERLFWQLPGVYVTAVGYAGGYSPNPTYQEVCSGMTGHAEVVRVVFDPQQVSFESLLRCFWQQHNPTQGMRQGNDVGTQYRSAIYCRDETMLSQARVSCEQYQRALSAKGFALITTEIALNAMFYFAESDHQQYLAKNPFGYCGLAGSGVVY